MYYIQRFKKEYDVTETNLQSFIQADYMGSAEFEFGTLARTLNFFKEANDLKLFSFEVKSKGGLGALVTFHVVTNEEGFERFKKSIVNHMDGTTKGRKSKGYTGLWDKFNAYFGRSEYPDFWLCVDDFINQGTEGIGIAFTASKKLAIEFLLYFKAKQVEDPRLFDEVLLAESFNKDEINCFKIVGLLEDDSIVAKNKKGITIKKSPRLVYQYDIELAKYFN